MTFIFKHRLSNLFHYLHCQSGCIGPHTVVPMVCNGIQHFVQGEAAEISDYRGPVPFMELFTRIDWPVWNFNSVCDVQLVF